MSTFQIMALSAGGAVGVFLLFVGLIALLQRNRQDVERLQTYVAPTKPAGSDDDQGGWRPLATLISGWRGDGLAPRSPATWLRPTSSLQSRSISCCMLAPLPWVW